MAVTGDVPRLLLMLRNFHAAGGFDFVFDAPRLDAFLRAVIAAPNGAVFVVGQPVVGLLVATHEESPLAPIRGATEHLIWVEPTARGNAWAALVGAYEAWARDAGCHRIRLFSQAHMRGEAVGRLFGRRGFEPLETAFSKVL